MRQSLKEQINRAGSVTTFTSVVLTICLMIGQGSRTPAFSGESFGTSLENYIAKSAPVDSGFASADRQVRVQNKAPRRPVSLGALPPGSSMEAPAACGMRSPAEAPCPASATPRRPSDRAPPTPNA